MFVTRPRAEISCRVRGKQCVRRSCLFLRYEKRCRGVERTWRSHRKMSAFEPYATLAVHCGNGFDVGFSSIKVSVCAAKMPSPELGAGQ